MRALYTGLFFLVFTFSTMLNAAGDCIEIDSLSGLAEVQRAGQNSWMYLKLGEKIYNNDMVRVLDRGHARLKWPDGSIVYVHKNSQIIINIFPRKSNTYLIHSTVLFGAAFFIIKKILPRELNSETKIYTPTAVISLRGTSFLVAYDREAKASSIKMINGTAQVGNIKKNVSIFLAAPFQCSITAQTDPIAQSAVFEADLDSLKQWVPPSVIDFEIATHLAKAKRDQVILSGKLDQKCLVVPFTDNSEYNGSWELKTGIPRHLLRKIKENHPTMNIEYVDSFNTDQLVTAFKHKARYLISGVIEKFDIIQKAEMTVRADEYRESITGIVKIRLEIVDFFDKKIISQENLIGEVSQKNRAENTWENLLNIPFDYDNRVFSQSVIGMALQQALERAIEKCDATLGL